MPKIAFIPIDNRPVCYALPEQIADLDFSCTLLIPKYEFLGNLIKPSNINSILDWFCNLDNIDAVVCTLDTIAYGGLVQSRRSLDNISVIKERINKFVMAAAKYNVPVYAFSSIMRISNNNINEEEKKYWNKYGAKIFEYSFNAHKSGDNDYQKYGIPKYILEDYLETRKRNFEINKYYIELANKGIFNTLVFAKDDCAKYGFNVKEAEELKKLSKGGKNIFIKTGLDEVPLVLLAKVLNKKKRIKIYPEYINEGSTDKISRYEDISVKKSTETQIELAGGVVSSKEDCDMILIVNNFKTEQGDLAMNISKPQYTGGFNIPDKPYCIADISNANGSDNNFAEAVLQCEYLKKFYGYAAWNTTGNTLGSVLAAALIYYGAKRPNKEAFDKLQLIRFLDDWAYQANVRGKIKNNKENLSEKILKQKMIAFEEELVKAFALKNLKIEYSFPWNRFFETEVKISENRANIY